MRADRCDRLTFALDNGAPAGILAAVAARVEVTADGHWLWRGSMRQDGYPRFWYRGRYLRMHVMVGEAASGQPLRSALQVHHKCSVRQCVSPAHLQITTAADNTAEMFGRRRFLARIAELEAALTEVAPDHELLRGHDVVAAA